MDPGTPHLEAGDKFVNDAEVVPFPRELDRRMAFDPPSVKRGFYKGYALVYNADTQVVLDVYQLFPFAPAGTLAASR